MTRIKNLPALLSVFLVFGFAVSVQADESEEALDIAYAEHVPLATESLMLDIIRAGDQLIAAGERGHIILSQDNGKTWTQADVVPTRSTFTSLFAAGSRIWAAGHDSVIVTSGDGGKNWTRQYFDPERQQPIMDLYFQDENRGFALGAYGLMLVTDDGGQNWEDWQVTDDYDAHLNGFIELENGDFLIAGEAGYSFRSQDDGDTWQAMDIPYKGSMFGAIAGNNSCVLFHGLRGHILRSCDGGDSWEELPKIVDATLVGAGEQDGVILMVGNSGTIVVYDDGRFTPVIHSSGVDFSSVLGIGNGQFILTGEEGTYSYPEQTEAGVAQ